MSYSFNQVSSAHSSHSVPIRPFEQYLSPIFWWWQLLNKLYAPHNKQRAKIRGKIIHSEEVFRATISTHITYFIFLTNIEKLTYFLIHFLDIFKFLKYFFENFTHFKKFNVFFWNFMYFSKISCIYKYVKSCICPLGLHYEIRECAYLSPRGIASKFKNAIKEFLPNFINSLKAFGEFLGSVSQFCPISDLEVFSPLDFYSFCLFFHCLGQGGRNSIISGEATKFFPQGRGYYVLNIWILLHFYTLIFSLPKRKRYFF